MLQAIRNQSTINNLQSICNLQSAICNLQFHHPVTAPVAADDTSRAYFPRTPVV